MNVLALDTACDVFSAALAAGGGIWYTEIDTGANQTVPRHSELIMDCVDSLFKLSGFERKDLDLAACMRGPGSFTGLRIGFSAAKGISLALGIPLASVPTLDCLAYPFSVWDGIVIPAIDAKKGCFFTAFYRKNECPCEHMDASPLIIAQKLVKIRQNPAEPVMLTGTGSEALLKNMAAYCNTENFRIDPGFRRGKARELYEIAKNGKLSLINSLNSGPVYLRKSDAELNWE